MFVATHNQVRAVIIETFKVAYERTLEVEGGEKFDQNLQKTFSRLSKVEGNVIAAILKQLVRTGRVSRRRVVADAREESANKTVIYLYTLVDR